MLFEPEDLQRARAEILHSLDFGLAEEDQFIGPQGVVMGNFSRVELFSGGFGHREGFGLDWGFVSGASLTSLDAWILVSMNCGKTSRPMK